MADAQKEDESMHTQSNMANVDGEFYNVVEYLPKDLNRFKKMLFLVDSNSSFQQPKSENFNLIEAEIDYEDKIILAGLEKNFREKQKKAQNKIIPVNQSSAFSSCLNSDIPNLKLKKPQLNSVNIVDQSNRDFDGEETRNVD